MQKGQKASPEQKKRYSEAAKKRWENMNWTPEMSKKRSEIASRINTGRVLSKKTKQKISNSVTGFKHTDKTKKQMSKTHTGMAVGEDNPNWNGGISPYPSGWGPLSKAIKERDNHQCQHPTCKGKSKILLTHHMDFDKSNDDPSNLITVCKSCHAIIHDRQSSIKNYHRKRRTASS